MEKDNCKRVGYQLRRLDNLIMKRMMANARAMNLDEVTVMNGWILTYIHRNSDRPIYQKDIETEFGINRSTVTNIVKLMEKKGLIHRETVPQDARLKRLVLTEKGIGFMKVSHEMIKQAEALTISGISEEELEMFFRIINRMKQNLENKEEKEEC